MDKTFGAVCLDNMLEPYAEENELLNDWVDRLLGRVRWRMAAQQGNWVYMAGELGKAALPKFKPNARRVMRDTICEEMEWFIEYLIDRLVAEYRLDNIELDDDLIEDMRYEMGGYEDEEDSTYNEWEAEARNRIFKDYAENLGETRTLELAKDWWGEDWTPNDV